ncbi:pilus assembly protein [Kineosporia sp. J2-2]|uniref:Pilus assembly protein n=1 Tax=Kineosporia corallincola TaxID=2835133 RepID=A0ABS5TQP5_9ACTN|nr:TadE family protein [Kineosporia corallincola]MBT0772631.1 pilus assembly protein [Kineosporia corallincola]
MSRRNPGGRGDRGQSSLEFALLAPVLLVVGLYVFQVAVAMWTMTSTGEATREAARAFSLGRSPEAAAAAALPGALDVAGLETIGPGHGVRLTVQVPRVAPMPAMRVTREVVMP